jgi:ribosome maturation factor RimP
MAASQVDQVRELVVAALDGAAEGTPLMLDDVTISPAGKRRVVRIVVDLPADAIGAVSMDAVAQASQAISASLDASPVMGSGAYVLEVSSPGAERALTQRRHWSRARRRLVSVWLTDSSVVEGRLVEVDDDGILLEGPHRRLGWSQVARGRVRLDFSGGDS